MNVKENVQNGDFVYICFGNGAYDLARIIDYDRNANRAELDIIKSLTHTPTGKSSLIIDRNYKWKMISPVPVEGYVLKLLGFKPVTDDVAYGKTFTEWVKNELWNTWTLRHDTSGGWELTLDAVQNGMSRPLRRKSGIGWIWQIQHCLSNPEDELTD